MINTIYDTGLIEELNMIETSEVVSWQKIP